MPLYKVQVRQTIEATVEVHARSPKDAEVLAEMSAQEGDYDDIYDDLLADATYASHGPVEIEATG